MRLNTVTKSAAAVLITLLAGASWAAGPNDNKTTPTSTSAESNQPVGDTWITTKVKSELLADSDVKGTDINVSTKNGVVTLAGVLDNQMAIDKAITIAKNIKGVSDVDTRALKLRK
ncbi:BON domain-containing protein [Tahibacter soli]|jgi:hyperosmotically inducible protein|uniref:BON domain-containing protein n=1 Tax=Tahibacter soli TaxID=2983605 RepID=A0A9X4BK67_9GAMM|nr:BON domain-containing protein [Tahibacter soli]MDC8013932.1 BON domain-containing protein [Tahibacter soli]